MFYNESIYYLLCFYIWEKSCSWHIGQNALSQSDCRIFKSTSSSDQIDEPFSFFACWCKFKMNMIQNEKLNEKFLVEHGQEYLFDCISKMNRWNTLIFLRTSTNSGSWFNDLWVGVVKNGHGLLDHETLTSFVC